MRQLIVETLEYRELMASDTFLDPLGNRLGFIPRPPASIGQPSPGTNGLGGGALGSGITLVDPPLSDTFKLHSRPTASKTIFLDFDGFTAAGTLWNQAYNNGLPIVSRPYDLDGNGPEFTDRELRAIQTMWQQVAADFAPFDVNVTTEDPGEDALVNTGGGDTEWGIRVVFTPDAFLPAGGVAYIDSFQWGYQSAGATDTPCYVFNDWPAFASAAASHEVGHSVGLSHDGTNANNPFQQNAAYYEGHGGNGENSWGPIMGVGGYYRNVTTWDNGIYLGANNGGVDANFGYGADDISVIARPANGFGILQDDHGNGINEATDLGGPIDNNAQILISQLATIERASDLDFFRLQVGSGKLNLTFDPYVTEVWTRMDDGGFAPSVASSFLDGVNWSQNQGANLDIEARLYDASGEWIATSNPNGLRASFVDLDITAGIYYISVDGVGFGDPRANPPTGYTDYASIGQYFVSGSVPAAFGIAVLDTSIEYIENNPPIAITSSATVVDRLPGDYSTGSMIIEMFPVKGATDIITLDYSGTSGLVQVGSLVFLNGTPIAQFSRSSDTNLRLEFNASTTVEAIEALVNSIRFEASGDQPDTFARSVMITLSKGSFRGTTNVQVDVISVNDAPIAITSFMDEINEDTTNPPGNTVAQLIDRGVVDPDSTRGTGIILTGVASGSGRWQYDIGTGWNDVANLSPSNGLVLGPSSKVRFLPVLNFFGDAPVLSYYALDPLYRGGFSSPSGVVRANVQSVNDPSSISVAAGQIRQVVRPANDAPSAVPPFPIASATQDTPFVFEVPSSLFTDIDDSVLTLSALTAAGRPLPSWLSFDPITRAFRGTPRNQDVGQQQFLIRAMDASGAFADAPFIIDVANVNDAPNDLRLLGQPVPENARGARIGRLTVLDPDPNDSHTWSVVDPRFEVRGNELFLVAQSSFNFELESSVQLAIRVADNGLPQLSFETTITILVADVNEFAPQLSPLTLSVSENANAGSFVGQVFATDGDTANRIRYRFFGAAPSQFQLQPDTGVLTVRPGVSLDYETTPTYQFFVEAFDDGVPSLSTWVSVDVALRDVNEFAPVIMTQSLSVSEDTAVGRTFGRVSATDGFSIDSVTGELRLNRNDVLDFERSSTEQLTVIATDSGTPGLSSQRQVILQVLNANDPPTSMSLETKKVLANLTGINLGRITVQDPDGPTEYAIIMPLDTRFEVVEGNLVFGNGQYLKDTDPSFITVPFLLRETAGGPTYRLDIQLERLLNPTPWRNSAMPFDVDRSGDINPLDVLAVINVLNSIGSARLPIPRDSSSLNSADVDVDGDGQISPLDVLAIINALNSPLGGGEGESARASQATEVDNYFAQFDADSDPLISRHRRTGRRF
ncbi:MAG: cadherin domain-containing protein [Pirellula sp.]|nr:cadherin domain-containing protein [Pirellula sp.]